MLTHGVGDTGIPGPVWAGIAPQGARPEGSGSDVGGVGVRGRAVLSIKWERMPCPRYQNIAIFLAIILTRKAIID